MYRGRDLSLQYARTPMYRIDFGANYTILKGKGTLSARVNDMFNMMHFGFDGNIPYKQVGEFHWESRTCYLGFSYNFGGGKTKNYNVNKEIKTKRKVAECFNFSD